ncbi:DUF4221 family protein [Arthrospiribacter ruber]|nr:DUF4221 family protein [Arthrospiribacter ruber]
MIILISCQKNERFYVEKVQKYHVGVSKLSIDDSTSLDFIKISYLHVGDKEYLFHQNEFKRTIQVFDLKSGFVENEIRYPVQEPFGLKVVQGITAVSLDSIFVFLPLSIRGTLLINGEGEILDRFMPNKEEDLEKSLINHVSFGAMPTLLHEGKIRFIKLPLFELSNPANINEEFRFETIYDVENNLITEIPESSFPEFYHNKIWAGQDLQVSRTIDNAGRIIYSWKYLDSLIIVEGRNLNKVFSKSEFLNKKPTPFSMIPSSDQKAQHIIENTKYYGIYYDKYRDLYYRTVQLPGIYDKNGILKEMDSRRGFSVMVLDNNFNKIEEVRFPGGIYNIYRAFVGKQGLYLPKNNVLNPDLVENYLDIDIFDFTADE